MTETSVAFAADLTRLATASLAALAGPRLAILTFHRVHPKPDALFPSEVDVRQFTTLMKAVARAFKVLPLREATRLAREGRLPARALAITFDDGYADNQEQALPVLQQLSLPATFFVATGFLNGGRMWNDTVIETVRHCALPQLDLTSLDAGLGCLPLSTLPQRRAAIERILPFVKYKSLEAREPVLEQLHRAAGQPRLPQDLMMRSDQVLALHAAGMEIGGHTVNHPILTELTDAQADQEIRQGRESLQALIGGPVLTFAYPNGRPGRDYAARHVGMVREAGFEAAVTTAVGVSRAGDDPHQLPRFTPWDQSPVRWLMRLALMQKETRFALAQPLGPTSAAKHSPSAAS
jgi:peptidoglycan/xylan/chitin deacetylase (PgdA/CDA1 family)